MNFKEIGWDFLDLVNLDQVRTSDGLLLMCLPFTIAAGPSASGLITILSCFTFETPPNLEGKAPVFISPMNRVAQAFGSRFLVSCYGGGIRKHLQAGAGST
jgi:hypothetical protein